MSAPRSFGPKITPTGIALAVIVSVALWIVIVGGFYLLWLAVGL